VLLGYCRCQLRGAEMAFGGHLTVPGIASKKPSLDFNATTESRDSLGEIKATLSWKSAPGDGPAASSYVKSQSLQAVGYAPDYAISVSQIADPNPVQAGQILLYTISTPITDGMMSMVSLSATSTIAMSHSYLLSHWPIPEGTTCGQLEIYCRERPELSK
jgi:hypothetical protein